MKYLFFRGAISIIWSDKKISIKYEYIYIYINTSSRIDIPCSLFTTHKKNFSIVLKCKLYKLEFHQQDFHNEEKILKNNIFFIAH